MNRNQQKAYSLLELLVALTVVVILLSLATPSFTRFQENKRQESLRDLLASHINQTRAKAVTQGRPFQLCGSSDGVTCDGDWGGYWLITTTHKEPTVLRQQQSPSQQLCWAGFSSDIIRFHPNGTSPVSNGTFSICREGGPHWQLVLNRQGRLRHSSTENSDCC